jgi:hypothetical protein
MKKMAVLALIILALAFLLTPFLQADGNDDLQAIKKAVKENPNYEAGKEVKWFKILVTDNKTNKDKVKVTLPISVVEVFFNCTEGKAMKIHKGDCEIDLRAVFKELKALGPVALIEVNEDSETVKIWFE